MLKNSIIYFAYIVLILATSCASKYSFNKNEYSDVKQEEYYNLFTEATRLALVNGDFVNAVGLYQQCIKMFPEKAAPYYQISNIYISVNDIGMAKPYAIKAVHLNDSNFWYYLHLANIYQYEDNIDSVICCYEKVVKLIDYPEYRYNLAVFYARKGFNEKSLKLINELEMEGSESREIILMKHGNYDALNLKDSAVIELEKLIKLFPEDVNNYGLLAEYLSEINRTQYAGKIYKELLALDPNNGIANVSYADFLMSQGQADSALLLYVNGLKQVDIQLIDKIGIVYNFIRDPVLISRDSLLIDTLIQVLKESYDDYRPYMLASEYFIKRQKYTDALIELKFAILKGTDSYIIYEQYFMISNYLRQYDNVKEIYIDAINKFPNEINLVIYSSFALNQLGEYDSIINICYKALKINEITKEEVIQTYSFIADAYRLKKKYVESDSIFEIILTIDPENLLIRNNYGYYLSLRGEKLHRAEELSKLTVKKEPRNSSYLDTYGWILYKMGNLSESLKYLQSAIKYGGYNSSEVLDHYGDVNFDMGNYKEAIEAWHEAIKYSSIENESILNKIKEAELKLND